MGESAHAAHGSHPTLPFDFESRQLHFNAPSKAAPSPEFVSFTLRWGVTGGYNLAPTVYYADCVYFLPQDTRRGVARH